MRLIAAAAAALVILGIAATTASSSTGAPLVLGQQNEAGDQSTVLDAAPYDSRNDRYSATLRVTSPGANAQQPAIDAAVPRGSNANAIDAFGGVASNGDVFIQNGMLDLADSALTGLVPAGARSVRIPAPLVKSETGDLVGFGELQGVRHGLWVSSTTVDRAHGEVIVHLDRSTAAPVRVAVMVVQA
jgi:hypothetical protein